MMSHVSLGVWGELYVAAALRSRGFEAIVSPAGSPGDLFAFSSSGEIVYIEVKTARRSVDGKWRFTLLKRGHTDHRRASFVVLLAVLSSGVPVPFVVPVSYLRNRCQTVITSHPLTYGGRLSPFRYGWHLIEGDLC